MYLLAPKSFIFCDISSTIDCKKFFLRYKCNISLVFAKSRKHGAELQMFFKKNYKQYFTKMNTVFFSKRLQFFLAKEKSFLSICKKGLIKFEMCDRMGVHS